LLPEGLTDTLRLASVAITGTGQVLLNDMALETPLPADSNASQSAITQHSINRRAINLKQVLELSSSYKVLHLQSQYTSLL
jgi:hypothetical protein